MISFTLLTSTPAVVRTFLLNRGIVQQVTEQISGKTLLVGLLPGLEWVEVPNPIVTSVGPPPVMDTRHVYLVKFAHENQADQEEGIDQTLPPDPTPAQILNRTKFGQWLVANGARNDLNVNGTTIPAYKVTGQNIWAALDKEGLLGSWQ